MFKLFDRTTINDQIITTLDKAKKIGSDAYLFYFYFLFNIIIYLFINNS